MVGKLVIGVAVAGVGMLLFIAGWLRGYIDGAEGATGTIYVLRRIAQCVGDDGCEWVLNESTGKSGQPVTSIEGLGYHSPCPGTPILGRLIRIDVAGPLRRISADE